MTTDLKSLKTLTGLSLEQVFAEFDKDLGPGAYKGITGSHGKNGGELTDIDPNYMTELLTLVFGPWGKGFGFEYEAAHMTLTDTGDKGMNRFIATLAKGIFWYVTIEDGKPVRNEIQHPGGSINARPDFAQKGAVTSATAGAVSRLLFQISVYKGLRSHETTKKKKTQVETEEHFCDIHNTAMTFNEKEGKWGHRISDSVSCLEGVEVDKKTHKPIAGKK
jgi:hypothetical protein